MFSTARRRGLWFGALGLAALVGSLSLVYQERYVASVDAVRQNAALESSIAETLSILKDAETGQRGFILTDNPAFLAPYDEAVAALSPATDQLVRLAHVDPAQLAGARHIEQLSALKMDELAETIALRKQGRSDAALATVRDGRGHRFMEAIRREAEHMRARERARLATLDESASQRQRELFAVLGGIWGLLLCLGVAGAWSATRGVAEAKRSNEWLRRSEQALRAVADNATDLVRIIGEQAQLLYVSPSCQLLLGYTQAEMLDMGPRALMHEDEREAARLLTQAVQAGTADERPFVHRLRVKGGEYRWFETSYRLIREAGVQHIHLTSRDVTERRRAEDALRRQTTRLESILESMGDGVLVLDEERRVLVVNPAARDYIRFEAGEYLPVAWSSRYPVYLPDGETRASVEGPLTRALEGQASDGVELVVRDPGRPPRSFSVTAHPIVDRDAPAGCVAVYRDITEQQRARAEIQENEARLRVLSEASFEGIAITKAGLILEANENFASWLGRTREELIGTDGLAQFAPEDREHVKLMSAASDVQYEAHLLRRDGSRFPVEVRGRFIAFRGENVRIAVVRDVTEKKRREAELKEQAELLLSMSLRDELTGLYNRRGFLEHAQTALRTVTRMRLSACVFFVDLNGMKRINDTFGHEAGDRAIAAAGRVLTSVFRESDVVARLGGDEFAVFAAECSQDDVAKVHERVRLAAEAANGASGEPFAVTMSVGASCFAPGSRADLTLLLEDADRAMYDHKRRSRS